MSPLPPRSDIRTLWRFTTRGAIPMRGVYFLVMDYVKGDTLRDIVAFGGAQTETVLR